MKKSLIYGSIFLLTLSALFFVSNNVRAQQSVPQFLVTWKASSYTPVDYWGKVMPTANSPINVSFELLVGGKLADLSRQTIYWYLNDDLLAGGIGIQSLAFVPIGSTDKASIRIQIPNYYSSLLVKDVDIPLVSPQAVIYAPYPNNNFNGKSLQVSAIPYFFNTNAASSLNYSWNVNDQTPTNLEDPSKLTVNLGQSAPTGSTLDVQLSIINPAKSFEAAAAETFFTSK